MFEPTAKDKKVLARFKERLPERLFRYTGLDGARFGWLYDTVLRSILFFPSFAMLNDPAEGTIALDFRAMPRLIRRFWDAWHREQAEAIDDRVRAQIEQHVALRADPTHLARLATTLAAETASYGVICFTESPIDKRMWTHYAGSHQGVCLEYRTDKLFGRGWPDCLGPIPVRYATRKPRPAYYRASRQERTIALVGTKGREWITEREWRTVRYGGQGAMRFDPAALVSVTLGCRMPDPDRDRIVDMVGRRPGVRLQEVQQNERDFRLRIHALKKGA